MRPPRWHSIVLILATVVGTSAVGTPWHGVAEAHGLAAGTSLAADFKGNGRSQIATVYDLDDDFGMRIDVLERGGNGDAFTRSTWFAAGPGSFDTGRMKLAAADVDFDGRADIVALHDDGGTSVRLLVWRSTGNGFAYTGNDGWWRSNGYAWSRAKNMIAGNFSAIGRSGLLVTYQYDNFQMRVHYFESDGKSFIYGGNGGVYDSGPGQYDTARAQFAVGRFTRASGPDQLVSLYQYPNARVRIHVFEPSPTGLQPVNGWAGVYDTGEGQYDLNRAKLVAADVNGDGRTDLASLYGYDDGSARVHLFSGAANLAFTSAAGIAQIAPGQLDWGASVLAGGDWDGDRRADLATLAAHDDGSTHVATLRSDGTRLAFAADAWVSPPAEARALSCTQCWPLRGTPIGGGDTGRRPLYVKIDNNPSARPHHGINAADIVFEWLVEGMTTRLAAVYHSQDPDVVGSVRSGRHTDRPIVPAFRGAIVYSGAAPEETGGFSYDDLVGRYKDLNAAYYGWSYRVGFRSAPYNMFTTGARMREAVRQSGGGDPVTVARWPFLAASVRNSSAGGFAGSVAATSLAIPYRGGFDVRYTYDAMSRTYARSQAGAREVDGATGVPVAARTVVVIFTDIALTDRYGLDAAGSPKVDMRLQGTGQAAIFRDGRRQTVTWTRPDIFDPYTFTNASGQKVLLGAGQTWIHVIPKEWTVPSE